MSHNFLCSPQGGKLSQLNPTCRIGKTILGGNLGCSCYESVWCLWGGGGGGGETMCGVTCASSPCTASLMLDRDLTEVT